MIRKIETLHTIAESGVVAVVRAERAETAARIAHACAEGGIKCIEITFTVPRAHRVLEDLTGESSGILWGAGTVLDAETARIAILAGARFIVSPSFHQETGRLCQRYQIPYLPGAQTVTEVLRAIENGGDLIKLFPGETLGPAFVKAVRAPLPHVPLMPTGGVTVENAGEWIKAGCVAIGVGGKLTAGAAAGDFASVTALAGQFIASVARARRGDG